MRHTGCRLTGGAGVEVVKLRPRLAADDEHILKTLCRNKRNTRAATLKQSVRPHCRAMHNFDTIEPCACFRTDATEALLDSE